MMTGCRAVNLTLRGEVERAGDAHKFLGAPGQAVIVNRGCLRSIVFSCPDGCGEELTINLDPRAGKAWRLYRTRHGLTLFPSVWRDNGCQSHFIVWRDQILWCDSGSDNEDNAYSGMYALNPELDSMVIRGLRRDKSRSYLEIADEVNEIPWDVLQSCIRLADQRKAQRGVGKERDFFKLL